MKCDSVCCITVHLTPVHRSRRRKESAVMWVQFLFTTTLKKPLWYTEQKAQYYPSTTHWSWLSCFGIYGGHNHSLSTCGSFTEACVCQLSPPASRLQSFHSQRPVWTYEFSNVSLIDGSTADDYQERISVPWADTVCFQGHTLFTETLIPIPKVQSSLVFDSCILATRGRPECPCYSAHCIFTSVSPVWQSGMHRVVRWGYT